MLTSVVSCFHCDPDFKQDDCSPNNYSRTQQKLISINFDDVLARHYWTRNIDQDNGKNIYQKYFLGMLDYRLGPVL